MSEHNDDSQHHDDPKRPDEQKARESRGEQGTEGRERRDRERGQRNEERQRRRAERHAGRRHQGRKERVIHTRVSDELADDIRRLADDLRVPASNLVRNVLEEVFTVVETVTGDVGGILEDLADEAEGARDRIFRRVRTGREGEGREPREPRAERGRREPRRSHSRRRWRWDDGDRPTDVDPEAELRRDEAVEGKGDSAPGAEGGAASGPAEDAYPDILGWQPLVLNRERGCAECSRTIERGERAFIGLTEAGLSSTTLCPRCAQ